MRKYAISIDKVLFHIFPCNERVDQLSDILAEISRGSYAIMLFPSPFADFAIECYSADGKRVEESYLPITALSFFLGRVRGLPISEIDVAYFDRIYKLDALNPYIPEYKISGSGISDILAERTLLNDGMEIKTYFARGESAYRIYVTDDISHLDEHFISSLLFRGASFPDAALAVSYNECIRVRASGRLRHIEAVRFAFQALLFDGRINEEGKYTIAFDYARHNVRFCSNRLSFLMEIEYYSNLY